MLMNASKCRMESIIVAFRPVRCAVEIEMPTLINRKCCITIGKMLTDVPTEILLHIFSFLPPESLSAVSQTCRTLNSVTQVDSLWEPLCQTLPGFAPFQSWRDLYSSRWHKWSWLVGIWCGDFTHHGRSPPKRNHPYHRPYRDRSIQHSNWII